MLSDCLTPEQCCYCKLIMGSIINLFSLAFYWGGENPLSFNIHENPLSFNIHLLYTVQKQWGKQRSQCRERGWRGVLQLPPLCRICFPLLSGNLLISPPLQGFLSSVSMLPFDVKVIIGFGHLLYSAFKSSPPFIPKLYSAVLRCMPAGSTQGPALSAACDWLWGMLSAW